MTVLPHGRLAVWYFWYFAFIGAFLPYFALYLLSLGFSASRIAVLADLPASGWQETDFFSLALQASERFQRDDQVLTLFTYDLLDYKQVPDWLNSRFWANPENFGKYWW